MRREIEFRSFDGTKLYFVCDEVENPKAVIVLVHGLCEHTGRYEYVTKKLCENGYKVYRFDHRGHGKSEGKSTYLTDYLELSNDVYKIIKHVKAENKNQKIFVLGHSMGGHAVAGFGTRFPREVQGFILLGAITRQSHSKEGEFPILLPDNTYLENTFREGLCSDEKVIEDYFNDPMVPRKVSVGLLNRVWEGTNFLREHATEFVDPVLVFHGANDGIVCEKDSRDFFGEINSKDKTLKIFSGLCHELLNEPCKDEILAEIIAWIEKH